MYQQIYTYISTKYEGSEIVLEEVLLEAFKKENIGDINSDIYLRANAAGEERLYEVIVSSFIKQFIKELADISYYHDWLSVYWIRNIQQRNDY